MSILLRRGAISFPAHTFPEKKLGRPTECPRPWHTGFPSPLVRKTGADACCIRFILCALCAILSVSASTGTVKSPYFSLYPAVRTAFPVNNHSAPGAKEEYSMSLGSNLSQARKKSGLSQEEVAEKLGVSRQTISKWELDETLPDIRQSKKLSTLYHLTLDELIEVDFDVKEIERVIEHTSQAVTDKVDWTKVWAKQYPVLASYPTQVRIDEYASPLRALLKKLRTDYGYSDQDACLVLKDILSKVWKDDA